jgi:hypothetical protein
MRQLFPESFPESFLNELFKRLFFPHAGTQRLIDHGLIVTPALVIHTGAKPVEDVVVYTDGDA